MLDFGIARKTSARQALTQTGVLVGIPAYMAPEQVRGERSVGPAADVFALGCVLYECLAGRPPFFGVQIVSVLAKILFEEVPDIRSLRPGLPTEVAELLARMLAKDVAQRIGDGTELCAALSALPECTEDTRAGLIVRTVAAQSTGLRGEVQELLSIVVASATGAMRQEAETMRVATPELLLDGQRDILGALRKLGAYAEFLLDGSLVSVFRERSSATDQAALAAQAALFIHERWPAAQVAVTTGRGLRPQEMPMGEVLDRAARMLLTETLAGEPSSTTGEVVVDKVTAGLINNRFQVQKRGGAFLLKGVHAARDESKPLLGKPTPCVGRERELAQMDAVLASSIDESKAQTIIIVGPPGSGHLCRTAPGHDQSD